VQVRFFEVDADDGVSWESFGQFTPQQDVHHQVSPHGASRISLTPSSSSNDLLCV
jgi:hypothetical protein